MTSDEFHFMQYTVVLLFSDFAKYKMSKIYEDICDNDHKEYMYHIALKIYSFFFQLVYYLSPEFFYSKRQIITLYLCMKNIKLFQCLGLNMMTSLP